jgi:hypothetical protein
VDKAAIANGKLKPIEFLQDNHLEFVDEGEVHVFKVSQQFLTSYFVIFKCLQNKILVVLQQDDVRIILEKF